MTGRIIVAELMNEEHIATDDSAAALLPAQYAIFAALAGTGDTINAPRTKWQYHVVREVEVKHPLDTYIKICESIGLDKGSHPDLADLLAVFDFDFVVADMVANAGHVANIRGVGMAGNVANMGAGQEARHPTQCCSVM